MISKANIILTHKCNLKCLHCYMNAGNSNESFDTIYKNTIILIDKLGANGVTNIMFTGGECMLFPRLKELIEYTKKLGISTTIFTNGMIYNEEIFDLVDSVNISLDGKEKTHNHIRQNNMSYKSLIKVMGYLKQKDKKTTIQMTISDLNVNEIDFIGNFAVDYLNTRSIKLVFMSNKGRATLNEILNSNNNITKVMDKLEELYSITKYHIQISTNLINDYDFEQYFINEKPIFPVWFDMVDQNYYLFEEIESRNLDLKNIDLEYIYDFNDNIHKLLIKNKDIILSNKYIDIEQIIISIYGGN